MATQKAASVNFGLTKTGLTTVGYKLYNSDGTEKQARTTTGVTERGSSGIYAAVINLEDNWKGQIFWDTGEASPRYAAEDYNAGEGGGGGYSVVVDNIWSPQEKKELIDKLAAVFDLLNELLSLRESFATMNERITREISGVREKIKDSKKFDDILESMKFVEASMGRFVDASTKAALQGIAKLRKDGAEQGKALLNGIKESIQSIPPPKLDIFLIEMKKNMQVKFEEMLKQMDLLEAISAKLLPDEALEAVLKERGINVKIPYKRSPRPGR